MKIWQSLRTANALTTELQPGDLQFMQFSLYMYVGMEWFGHTPVT